MSTCGVYMIKHRESGRAYVGKSVNIELRFMRHTRERGAPFLASALRKYGLRAFDFTVLEVCLDGAAAAQREVHWIRALNTKAPHGFNLTEGGEGAAGCAHSEQSKAKIAAAMLGNRNGAGRAMTEATREALRQANLGNRHCADRRMTEENKRKLSDRRRGRRASEETRGKLALVVRTDEWRQRLSEAKRGSKHSDETRARMSAAHAGVRKSEETRARMSAARRRRESERT